MKQYPKIDSIVTHDDRSFYVYEKLDGSNFRVEWSKKRGFYKFGSRKRLVSDEDKILGKAVELAKEQYEKDFCSYFPKVIGCDRAICYFEFWGPKSFAGFHKWHDKHMLSLLDVEVYKRGFLKQKEYISLAKKYEVSPKLLYHGPITGKIEKRVREGRLGTFEGVVCKADPQRKHQKPLMFKIKNQAWIDKVKEIHKGNSALLKELL